jgi:hypothetical protein
VRLAACEVLVSETAGFHVVTPASQRRHHRCLDNAGEMR